MRAVATGASGGAKGSHPLPSGGSSEENVHRLASGGYGYVAAWIKSAVESDRGFRMQLEYAQSQGWSR